MATIEHAPRRMASDSSSVRPAPAPSTRASDEQSLRMRQAQQLRAAQPVQPAAGAEGSRVTLSERARELAAQPGAPLAHGQPAEIRHLQERQALLQMPQLSDQVRRSYAAAG